VRPDASGRVCAVSYAETDLVVDLSGSFTDGMTPADNPVRIVDTRFLP